MGQLSVFTYHNCYVHVALVFLLEILAQSFAGSGKIFPRRCLARVSNYNSRIPLSENNMDWYMWL